MKYAKRAVARIHLDLIKDNITNITKHLPETVKVCAVVKADAYGHGAQAVAHSLENKVDFFAVATAGEALELRQSGIVKPILILGYVWEDDYEELIKNEVRMALFKEQDAVILSELGLRLGKKALVHIKVNTGMNRIGFALDQEAVESVRRIRELPGVDVEGIFTHFARADEENKDYCDEQFSAFRHFISRVEDGCAPIAIHHCSNSAASMEYTTAAMDMVRLGIAMYGHYPSDEIGEEIPLFPAMELKSCVVSVKPVEMGEGISYNHTRILTEDKMVATIPVGYGDGYPRLLSNRGYVLIRGKKAQILGRVCMDQFMVDVTGIPDISEGDEVTLVGRDGDLNIMIEDLSELCGIFNYEFLCGIGKRIPREYV